MLLSLHASFLLWLWSVSSDNSCVLPISIAEQLELKDRLHERDAVQWQLDDSRTTPLPKDIESGEIPCRPLKRVAGVDISFLKGSNEHACASIVVLDFPSLSVVYEAFTYVSLPAPYIAGFLAFREVPALSKLYSDLITRCPGELCLVAFASLLLSSLMQRHLTEATPDVTLVDGNGVLHPHGFGLASHFGVLMDIPTIGVGKTFLHVDGLTKPDVKALMSDAHAQHHDSVQLVGDSGKVRLYHLAVQYVCSVR